MLKKAISEILLERKFIGVLLNGFEPKIGESVLRREPGT